MGPRLELTLRRKAVRKLAANIAANHGLTEEQQEQVSMLALQDHLNGKSAARALTDADLNARAMREGKL